MREGTGEIFSDQQLAAFFSLSMVGVAEAELPGGRLLRVNRRLCELLGRTPEQLLSLTIADLTHPEDIQRNEDGLRSLMNGEIAEHQIEKRYVRPDGGVLWAHASVVLTRGASGAPPRGIAIVQDIGARKLAEERIRENEKHLQRVTDNAPVLLAHCDREARYRFVNRPYAARFGRVPEELVGRTVREVVGPEIFARVAGKIERVLSGEPTEYELEAKLASGERQTLLCALEPERDSSGGVAGFFAAITNVTEQRHARERLRQSEERLQVLVKAAPVFLATADRELRYTWIHAGRVSWPRDAVGRRDDELHAPGAVVELMALKRRVLESGSGERREIAIASETQRQVFDMTVEPLRDAAGAVVGVITAAVDVTERSETERRKDEFLATLAHELRNPLAPIRNAARFIRLKGPPDPELQRAREMIERQVDHMSRLVDDLLDVSRITLGKIELQSEPLELAKIIEYAAEITRPVIEARRHQIRIEAADRALQVRGDAARLTQALGNILGNAAKYTEPGGSIVVTAVREADESVVRVRDSGIGIPAALLPHVFDLFVQGDRGLDRTQGGLGIGLALVRRLIELHGGRVEARSDGPGKGSEFIIRLPCAAVAAPAVHAAAGRAAPPAARRVLVVDDNKDAADSTAALLRLDHHVVQTAYSGPAALGAARVFKPEVIFLDLGLPGMDGYEIARRLREFPETRGARLIALTGYGQAEDRRRSREAGFDEHIVKPLDPELLPTLLETNANARAE